MAVAVLLESLPIRTPSIRRVKRAMWTSNKSNAISTSRAIGGLSGTSG